VLTHFLSQRRLGAYLDGTLNARQTGITRTHLASCARCQGQADELRRLQHLLKDAGSLPPPPDWTGFWTGVARGIEDAARPAPTAWPSHRWPRRRARVAVAGAFAAAALAALAFWQAFDEPLTPATAVSVRSARTELPGGTVMVYAPPEQDLALVWIFERE
jgi:anti-sigma factor RsiW